LPSLSSVLQLGSLVYATQTSYVDKSKNRYPSLVNSIIDFAKVADKAASCSVLIPFTILPNRAGRVGDQRIIFNFCARRGACKGHNAYPMVTLVSNSAPNEICKVRLLITNLLVAIFYIDAFCHVRSVGACRLVGPSVPV
jgi:hypothetical protein